MPREISTAGTYLGIRPLTKAERESGVISSIATPTGEDAPLNSRYYLIDEIKNFPDFGSEPATIDTTTMSNLKVTSNISDLTELDSFTYSMNFHPNTVKFVEEELDDTTNYAFCVMLKDGSLYEYIGSPRMGKDGGEVREVQGMSFSTSVASEPRFNINLKGEYDEATDIISLVAYEANDPLLEYSVGQKGLKAAIAAAAAETI